MVGLKPGGIQDPKQKSSPKLKGSAASIRALVPFCHQQCQELLDNTLPLHQAIAAAAHNLNECYKCLSHDAADWQQKLSDHSKDFAVQCDALQKRHAGTRDWRIKPKMHQFLEMSCSGSKPNMSWTYRDEDFGGSVAQLCRIKGGCWKKTRLIPRRCSHFSKLNAECLGLCRQANFP